MNRNPVHDLEQQLHEIEVLLDSPQPNLIQDLETQIEIELKLKEVQAEIDKLHSK